MRRSGWCSSTKAINVSDTFDWESNCLICGCEANIEKQKQINVHRRHAISHIESTEFVRNMLKIIAPLKDDYHREILQRISSVINIITVSAKYHQIPSGMLQKINECL